MYTRTYCKKCIFLKKVNYNHLMKIILDLFRSTKQWIYVVPMLTNGNIRLVSLNNVLPWLVSPFMKNSNFCTFEIASLVNVLGHYLRKYGSWVFWKDKFYFISILVKSYKKINRFSCIQYYQKRSCYRDKNASLVRDSWLI